MQVGTPAVRDKLGAVTQPPVVAMIGGGQLARMTHQAAIALGQTLRVLSLIHISEPTRQVR